MGEGLCSAEAADRAGVEETAVVAKFGGNEAKTRGKDGRDLGEMEPVVKYFARRFFTKSCANVCREPWYTECFLSGTQPTTH